MLFFWGKLGKSVWLITRCFAQICLVLCLVDIIPWKNTLAPRHSRDSCVESWGSRSFHRQALSQWPGHFPKAKWIFWPNIFSVFTGAFWMEIIYIQLHCTFASIIICMYVYVTFRDREREKQNGLVCIIVSSNIPGSSPTLLNPTSVQRIGMKTSSPGPQTTEILRRVFKTTPHARFNMFETKSGKTCCFSMSMFVSVGLCSQLSLITYLICWLSHHCWWPLSVSCFNMNHGKHRLLVSNITVIPTQRRYDDRLFEWPNFNWVAQPTRNLLLVGVFNTQERYL